MAEESSNVDPEIDLQAQAVLDGERRLGRWLKRQEGKPDIQQELSLERASRPDVPVVSYPVDAYRLTGVTRFIPKPLLKELHDVLDIVRAINEDCVGMLVSRARLIADYDDRTQDVRMRLRGWVERYVRSRLKRPNPKDEGVPFNTFNRLHGELVQLEESLVHPDAIHDAVLADMGDYLPWLLYQKTWASMVEIKHRGMELMPLLYVKDPDPRVRGFCMEVVGYHGWAHEGALELILRRLTRAGVEPAAESEVAREQIADVAGDIEEMRPFLMRNFRVEKTMSRVGDMLLTWFWFAGRKLGHVYFWEDERQAIEHLSKGKTVLGAGMMEDGLVINQHMPWFSLEDQVERYPDAHGLILAALQPLHEKLLSFYAQVDLEAVLAGDDAELRVAVSCQQLGEAPEEEKTRWRIPRLRMQQLLGLLEDRLGCEVRQGKGSEVVVWRPGGHHFRLGRHKRNPRLSSLHVRRLLRCVKISAEEWLEAVGL